ncbi:MAG TPA: phosphodiesterase [Desulfobacterales bacterium]|nr:phosphodiesterase [Desulfobacterales bacterium]
MDPLVIAQISDFHLKPPGALAYGVADTAIALRRAVDHLNRLVPLPHAVLVTGDLVDEGAPASYRVLREILIGLRMPFFMVPGNHDHKGGLRAAFPDHRYLDGLAEADGRRALCYCIEEFALRLVGLDTVIPGEHGGGLNPGRLAWLDRVLSERPTAPSLVFMHHPPFASGIGHMDGEPFIRREELAGLLRRHPQVERITCGHIHRAISRRFAGTVATVTPGIGMQLDLDLRPEAPSVFVMEPAGFLVHVWTDLWGDPTLLTHVGTIPERPGQYGGPHPFFDVVSPK